MTVKRNILLSVLLVLAISVGLAGCAAKSSEVETTETALTPETTETVETAETSEATASQSEYSSKLFDKDVITINITAKDEDWQSLMENATSKPSINADIEIDGVTFKEVGIKTKGNTSLTQVANSGSDRFSLKINFDKNVDGQNCYGLDTLVLNNLYSDTSYLKEYMSYKLMAYMDVPSSEVTFADISVNGEHYGFFIAVEDVDNSFLKRNFGEDYTGEAYKPESFDMEAGAGNGMGDAANNGGGNVGGMTFDITTLLTLTDSSGNEVEWASVLPEGFDSAAVATITYADGSTTVFNMRDLASADLSSISALTDENDVSVDLSAYTLSMAQMAGGLQTPNAQGNDNTQTTPDTNAAAGGQMPGNGGTGMDGGSLGVNLVYTDDEIASYSNIFDNAITKPDEEDEQRLIATLKAISTGENLENYIDVDEVLRYAAVNVFLVNMDSYFSNMGHNYCLYEDNGMLSMIPWDYNLSFGTYNSKTSSAAINYAIDTVFSGVTAEQRPIIGLLLENPEYLNRYHEYLAKLVEYVTSGQFDKKVDAISASMDTYVKNDTTSFYDYDSYTTGVEAIKTFAKLRAESVSGQLDGSIPSTEEGQSGSDALIDTSNFDISQLGGMNKGGG
jgi:spore coat protein CotH